MATPLAELIRRLQGERSQNEFAAFLGVDKSFLSRVLAGERSPDSIVFKLLARYPDEAAAIAVAVRSIEAPDLVEATA